MNEVSTDALRALWSVERGQLWTIAGRHGTTHRLLVGDCREPEDVVLLMDGARATVVFTSPPYAERRRYDEASDFKPIPPEEYVDWFEAVQLNVRRHLASDGSWFVNIRAHSEDGERHPYVLDLVLAHKRQWRWCFIDDLVWTRAGTPGVWPNRFKNAYEPVYHFALTPQIKFRPEAVSTPSKHAFRYDPAYAQDSVSGSGLLGKEHAAGYEEGLARPSNVIEIGTGAAPRSLARTPQSSLSACRAGSCWRTATRATWSMSPSQGAAARWWPPSRLGVRGMEWSSPRGTPRWRWSAWPGSGWCRSSRAVTAPATAPMAWWWIARRLPRASACASSSRSGE